MLKARVLLWSLTLLAGCNTGPRPATAVVDAAPAVQAAPPAPKPPPQPDHPKVVEVEAFGNVVLPQKVRGKGTIMVYIAEGDCLAKDARMLGSLPADPSGRFFIEVFPEWGKEITICAALIEGKGRPARYYARSKEAHKAEGLGEVELRDLVIELVQGPPHIFPSPDAK